MKVLVIEDQPELARFLKKGLESESIIVDVAHDGEEGIRLALLMVYDIIILDLHLPKVDGFTVATKIRDKKKNLPIVVLSGETDIDMKVKMLTICDDYVVKPFSLKEMVARLRAVRKRGRVVYADVLEVGDLRMDTRAYRVTRAGKEIHLRNKEFGLLKYLLENRGIVVSRSMILDNVWDMNVDPLTNTVDVHIRNLRKKVDEGYGKKLIISVPKRGYKIDG